MLMVELSVVKIKFQLHQLPFKTNYASNFVHYIIHVSSDISFDAYFEMKLARNSKNQKQSTDKSSAFSVNHVPE